MRGMTALSTIIMRRMTALSTITMRGMTALSTIIMRGMTALSTIYYLLFVHGLLIYPYLSHIPFPFGRAEHSVAEHGHVLQR